MSTEFQPPRRGWGRKFGSAFAGIWLGVRGQSSCAVHALATVAVVAVAWALEVDRKDWALLILAITSVWAAELLNSALERLARAITTKENEEVRQALDIASGAVLAASLGAATLGLLVVIPHLAARLK